jgi:hypothetical protein
MIFPAHWFFRSRSRTATLAAFPSTPQFSSSRCSPSRAIPSTSQIPNLLDSRQMKAIVLLEYYRQFGFVSSVLGGFAFTFFGVLLPVSTRGHAAALATFLAIAGSIAFLMVTLGMTFAATVPAEAPMPASILAQETPLSFCFLIGMGLLLASFGVCGWIHSCLMGIAAIFLAAVGALGIMLVLIPFLIEGFNRILGVRNHLTNR